MRKLGRTMRVHMKRPRWVVRCADPWGELLAGGRGQKIFHSRSRGGAPKEIGRKANHRIAASTRTSKRENAMASEIKPSAVEKELAEIAKTNIDSFDVKGGEGTSEKLV